MTTLVAIGALLQCDQGVAPAPLSLTPRIVNNGLVLASVDDYRSLVNVPSFGMCRALANPLVQAATMAAQGVLTPAPCVPVTTSPWTPGSPRVTVEVAGRRIAVLTSDSTCSCQHSGRITITKAGCGVEAG